MPTPRTPSRKRKLKKKVKAMNRGLFRTYVHVLFGILYAGFAGQMLFGAIEFWAVPCASHLKQWNLTTGSLYVILALARFMMRNEARCVSPPCLVPPAGARPLAQPATRSRARSESMYRPLIPCGVRFTC